METEFFMNYAEGKGFPTVKHTNEMEAIKEAERLAETLGVRVATLKTVAKTHPKDITKRVKTYNDACAILGINPEIGKRFAKDEVAYRKLKTIAKALNQGWIPDWENMNEYKYYPWFRYSGASAGFACANANIVPSRTSTTVGSRLCFKTRELAAYAGTQFIDIYNEFLL
jgi:hypothetical protein